MTFDVFLIAGQSNTHYGRSEDETDNENDANAIDSFLDNAPSPIYQLGRDDENGRSGGYDLKILPADEPLFNTPTVSSDVPNGIGFPLVFSREYLFKGNLSAGRKILLVPCGRSGSGFNNNFWNPTNTAYNDSITRVNHVLNNYEGSALKAILWHQGESDITNQTDAEHEVAFLAMLDGFRAEFGQVPFVLGGFVPYYMEQNAGRIVRNSVIANFTNLRDYMGYASPSVPSRIVKADNTIDSVHFANTGHRILGVRYYEAYLRAIANEQSGQYGNNEIELKLDSVRDGRGVYGEGTFTGSSAIVNDATRGNVLSMPDENRASGGLLINPNWELGSSYSKSVWVKLSDNEGNNNIWSSYTSGTAERHIFWITSGNLRAGHGTSTNQVSFAFPTDGEWHQVGVTYDATNGNMVLYLNGSPVDSATITTGFTTSHQDILGGFLTANNRLYGFISQAQGFKRALRPEEMAQVYINHR